MPCRNAVSGEEVRRHFESRARQDYIGQQQAWDYVRSALESYIGLTPRATCKDWVLHFTGPSGSGKTFLAEIIASAAFDEWEDEMYSKAQLGAGISSCAGLGAAGMMFGPLAGAIGCAAGTMMAYTATDAAAQVFPSLKYFRSTKPFPGQCGVLQHKFSRGSDLAEVEAFEYAAAQALLRDPKSVFILDDIGRLSDSAAYEHLGRLLCGVGGNAVPEFRTQKENPELIPAPRALFILTSDLVLGESRVGGGECGAGSVEAGSFEQMLGAVRAQSSQFWAARKQITPDWWADLPIVPFRELCADEITDAVKKYLLRQCDNAGKRLDPPLCYPASWLFLFVLISPRTTYDPTQFCYTQRCSSAHTHPVPLFSATLQAKGRTRAFATLPHSAPPFLFFLLISATNIRIAVTTTPPRSALLPRRQTARLRHG
jgi:hypothetical protein